jgi:general secretion pathway protein J
MTAFIATKSAPYDRVDYTAFGHLRVERDAKESDQAEIGYFVVRDPDVDGKMDLVRREQAPIDFDPKRGGVVNVLAEDVESFDLKYLDPLTGTWTDSWDSTQVSAQVNRLPIEVRVELKLKSVKNTPEFRYVTKVILPIRDPLKFGIPQQ